MAKSINKRGSPPGKTPETREKQLISMATNEAERRIADGSATSQLLVHFLKLGTTKYELEKEKIKQENMLLEAKTNALKAEKELQELNDKVLASLKEYKGDV